MNALMLCHRRSLLLLYSLCLSLLAAAQPKAAFTATPASGCSPLVVFFTDQSTGNPAQWKWDLGNGVISYLKNPSATYFNPGTYTVKLTVTNARGADSLVKSSFITVNPNPVADFSHTASGACFPLPVQFTDRSTTSSGTVVSWRWDFGDGTTSAEPSPLHTYNLAGNFSVTLRVTNSFGCVNTITMADAVKVAGGVKAAFSVADPGGCTVPANVQFTNASTGRDPLSFQWSFGDGSNSSAASPLHVYSQKGKYTVSLIAKDALGCADTLTKPDLVNAGLANADFTLPAAACAGTKMIFTNSSQPAAIASRWDFGDGSYSSQLHAEKTYTQPGTFAVRLISNFGNCSDTIKKMVTVSPKPVADFTAMKEQSCNVPVKVQFKTTASDPGFTYAWDFGDSTTSTLSQPEHTYRREGSYTVRLVVTNAAGCSDTIIKTDFLRVEKPSTRLEGLPRTGCTPLTVSPVAQISGGHTISEWHWDFGDGTGSSSASPSHTYTATGTYTVRLAILTSAGCRDTIVYENAVRVGEKPKAAFVNEPKVACPFDRVQFTDKSTGTIDRWYWIFDDGGTSSERNPLHQYSDTGWQHVSLIVYNNTCPDTVTISNSVYINPPVSIFSVINNCDDRKTKQFRDISLGAQTWFWKFGDGHTSTERHPVHVYEKAGSYPVTLTVTSDKCSHYSVNTVQVIEENPFFPIQDTVICRNTAVSFTPQGIQNGNIAGWSWQFGDGSMTRDSITTQRLYTKNGLYPVTLTVNDLFGCQSSASMTVKVVGPVAAFQPSAGAACLKENLFHFTDASSADAGYPLVSKTWHFGDNTIQSTFAPVHHRYTAAGNYVVKLVVSDALGCSDSAATQVPIVVAQPVALFAVSDTSTCTGKNVLFQNSSQAASPVYQWRFGDGGSSAAAHPQYAYARTGLYTVQLNVTDQYGCKDSIIKEQLVRVSYPKAALTVSDTIGSCPPLLVHFANKATGYTSIRWEFGDGGQSKLDTPSHFYAKPGTYYAKLIATGPGGCSDTVQQKIVVKGPSGELQYSPLTGCKPLTVNFRATTRNDASFIWDFSDGTTMAGRDTTSHTYVTAGEFVPRIILTDAAGCTVPIEGSDTIRVTGVVADFSLGSNVLCNEGKLQFQNRTVSNDFISQYRWIFGDGGTSNERNPVHHYTEPGVYSVTLVATTRNGCTDSVRLQDTVKVFTGPLVAINSDSAGCAPVELGFTGSVVRGEAALLTWRWQLGDGREGSTQNLAPQLYAAAGTYKVTATATDNNGCSHTASTNVTVHPTPNTSAGEDQWICRGAFYQLKATGASRYVWQPAASLSCTDCDSPLAAPAEVASYVVTGYNAAGCSSRDTVTIRVHQPFQMQVGRGDTICAGQTIKLLANGAERYTWTPSAGVKEPLAANTTATPQASTRYTVIGRDNAGCFSDTGHIFVKVWPLPTVKTGAQQTLSIGNSLKLAPTYSNDITSYQWSNAQTLSCANCPAPVAKPKTETQYTIAVANAGGCVATDAVTVRVICNDGNLFIPNTFSPNGDGTNDHFYPRGTGISSIKSLKVFNRWGQLVFSRENFNANDAAAGWDGLYKGQAATPDVFIYTCEVVCMNNEVLSYKGDLTLLR